MQKCGEWRRSTRRPTLSRMRCATSRGRASRVVPVRGDPPFGGWRRLTEAAMTTQSFDAARDAVARIVRDHWKLFLIEGIILVHPSGIEGLIVLARGPRYSA